MVPRESELATITLTAEAEQRLGITTTAAEIRSVQQHRTFGGEVVIPSGKSIMIAAPVAGNIKSTIEAPIPLPGAKVKAGDAILTLAPILSPERDVPTPAEQVQMAGAKASLVAAQVTALGDVQRGRADVTATQISLDRANKLLADRAGSQRAVDDATALSQVAVTVLAAAEERYAQLTKLLDTLNEKPGRELATELIMRAPVNGVIRNLSVSEGQQVIAGAALLEVLDTSTVWIRVPIFVDLLPSIPTGVSGRVVSLDGKRLNRHSENIEGKPKRAAAIDAPPTADAGSSTADLYFEVSNEDSGLRPGQRIGIELPMNREVDATIIPAASVLYDIYGNTWVYTLKSKKEHRYERERVAVLWFDGTQAILHSGPDPGTMVVTEGAAELFGTEFGPGK